MVGKKSLCQILKCVTATVLQCKNWENTGTVWMYLKMHRNVQNFLCGISKQERKRYFSLSATPTTTSPFVKKINMILSSFLTKTSSGCLKILMDKTKVKC